jgi:hypothetical protein
MTKKMDIGAKRGLTFPSLYTVSAILWYSFSDSSFRVVPLVPYYTLLIHQTRKKLRQIPTRRSKITQMLRLGYYLTKYGRAGGAVRLRCLSSVSPNSTKIPESVCIIGSGPSGEALFPKI